MTRKIIHLDLTKNVLIGWEKEKSDLVVKSMVRGIDAGDNFPAVPIIFYGGAYYIFPRNIEKKIGADSDFIGLCVDGGHHRAVAHFIYPKPLKCDFLGEQQSQIPLEKRVPISNIILFKDDGLYRRKLREDSKYR